MYASAAAMYDQADSFRAIAERAHGQIARFPFNLSGQEIWAAIERAARRCRVERLDRARALETV